MILSSCGCASHACRGENVTNANAGNDKVNDRVRRITVCTVHYNDGTKEPKTSSAYMDLETAHVRSSEVFEVASSFITILSSCASAQHRCLHITTLSNKQAHI